MMSPSILRVPSANFYLFALVMFTLLGGYAKVIELIRGFVLVCDLKIDEIINCLRTMTFGGSVGSNLIFLLFLNL